MPSIELPEEYSLVLQEVNDLGEEEINDLAELLSFEKSRLLHIVQSLQHKGLVVLHDAGHGIWVRLSAKGRKLMDELWPESRISYGM